ncbi:hypothetical protein ALC62_02923 [Cyphomyrmex costatus]|uniref:Uncharacterized protein n=1 Tax=Cyphomyrmex costatus TaxID=456900 RepID=A0A195CZX9_9HYME|nr:hypothetical protein ALC62_02923 [Cyphomyrmex costatus]
MGKTQSRLETNRKNVKLTVVLKSPASAGEGGRGATMNLGLPGRAVVELYRKTQPCIKHKAILYKAQVSSTLVGRAALVKGTFLARRMAPLSSLREHFRRESRTAASIFSTVLVTLVDDVPSYSEQSTLHFVKGPSR